MKRAVFFLSFLFCLSFLGQVWAQESLEDMPEEKAMAVSQPALKNMSLAGSGEVKEILKSNMVLMTDDKRYRLGDILIPVDYDSLVKEHLEDLLRGKKVKIYVNKGKAFKGAPEETLDVDRYGIPLVQLILEQGGKWAQADLVQNGLAFVYNIEGFGSDRIEMLLEMEEIARKQRSGFWSNPLYEVKTPQNIGDFKNSFQIVEGNVLSGTTALDKVFLNFGKDWKTDFTIEVPYEIWRNAFASTDLFSMLKWSGQHVRVRGWVQEKNGPMIEVNNINQIEILKK